MSGAGYGLVMPFVVCESQGGPYDDNAFAAGYRLGLADARLAAGLPIIKEPFRLEELPQLDLIGMRYGYEMWSAPPDEDESPDWSLCTMRRPEPEEIPHG